MAKVPRFDVMTGWDDSEIVVANPDGKWVLYEAYAKLLLEHQQMSTELLAQAERRLASTPSLVYEPSSGMGDCGGGSPNQWPGKYGMGRSG